ncbi:ATP-binding protein [Romboutsia weinsteinii]|uniref:ATP-binding protein n=1 Tax=Romboutsia weinsteinii TaxID=2020949 RepID=A0A255IMX3_9FIRM|nr:ATP-binding protein [Romboutsia weinsteinii]RDY27740.1 ATP-binding protein [Romboutsia weinsteinii]
MLNIDFYIIREIVSSIVFIVAFFVMMKKIGYVYKVKDNMLRSGQSRWIHYRIKFFNIYNIVNVFLIFLLIIIRTRVYFSGVVLIISIILLFLICKVSYSLDLKKALVYSVLYIFIYRGIELTLGYIILYIYIITKNKLNLNWGIYFDILRTLIISLCIILTAYYSDKLKNLSLNKKYYLYIGFTIVMNTLVIFFLNKASSSLYNLYNIISDKKIKLSQSFEIIPFVNFAEQVLPYIIIASNIVFIFALIKLLKSTQEKAKLEVINKKLDMQYNYYLNIKESQEKVKRLYHDINNHMTNIKVIQNKNDEVDKYVASINDELKDFESTYNTGNVILDIILSEKNKLCKLKNIEFLCNIDFSKCDFVEMIDVSSVFTNLLDNAIEACEKIENKEHKRYISIRGTIVKSYYIIKCENSKTNKVISKNNKILTSKKDKYIHGIGIDSIKSSIKKYDGEIDIQVEENKFVATIYIPLK